MDIAFSSHKTAIRNNAGGEPAVTNPDQSNIRNDGLFFGVPVPVKGKSSPDASRINEWYVRNGVTTPAIALTRLRRYPAE